MLNVTIGNVIRLLRPKQWAKNVLLFAGLVFSQSYLQVECVKLSVLGFLAFCMISSAIYVFNDIVDVDSDRLHPKKSKRPIASGAISVSNAVTLGVILFLLAFAIIYVFLNISFLVASLTYFLMMLLYIFVLKHCVIFDIMTISFGFVIRAISGVVVLQTDVRQVPLTPWFICTVFFLSLFLVVCKRRHEVAMLDRDDAVQHRKVLNEYSLPLLDQMVSISTTATIICYALYSVLGVYAVQGVKIQHPNWIIWTLPFVVFGIFRYLYLVYQKTEGGAPESVLFDDWGIIGCVFLWTIAILFCLSV